MIRRAPQVCGVRGARLSPAGCSSFTGGSGRRLQDHDLVGLRQRERLPASLVSLIEIKTLRLERSENMLRRIVDETLADDWLRTFIVRAVRLGVEQVGRELRVAVEHLDLHDVAGLHAKAASVEVQGIAGETQRRLLRAVAGALEAKRTPEVLMRDVRETLRKVTKLRLMMLVNTAVVRAVNAGKLYGYRMNAVEQVGIDPEWVPSHRHRDSVVMHDRVEVTRKLLRQVKASTKRRRERMRGLPTLVNVLTAGDDKVCEDCASLSEDGPYEIDFASDLLPLHPNCRCAFIPWDDRRYRMNR